jgi:hypothetical protein
VRHISLSVLVSALLASTASPVFTQTPAPRTQTSDEALQSDAQAYSTQAGIPLEEAKRRLIIMANASDLIAEVEAELGDSVAAVYFDDKDEFRLVAESSSPKKGKFNKSIVPASAPDKAAELTVDYVPSTKIARKVMRKALRDNKKSIGALFPGYQGFGYRERRGVLVVDLLGSPSSDHEEKRAQLSKTLKVPVELDYHDVELKPMAIIGGRWSYATSGGPLRPWCTTAFPARSDTGQIGMLTSGHCTYQQYWRETVNGQTVDKALGYFKINDQWEDWGFFTGVPVDARFYADNSGTPRTVTGRRTKGETNQRELSGTTLVREGSVVCWYGQASGPTRGQQCGAVVNTHYNPGQCPAGSGNPCEDNYIEVRAEWGKPRFYATDGDSGAPVFAWNTAFGIASRSFYYTDGTAENLVYTSIDEPYYWSYSLCYNGSC